MELLDDSAAFCLDDSDWRIYSKNPIKPPHYISENAKLRSCYVTEGCEIFGEIDHSVIFEGVTVGEGAKVEDSIIFPGATIGKGAVVYKSIVGADVHIGDRAVIGSMDEGANRDWNNPKICSDDITLIGPELTVGDSVKIAVNSMVTEDVR